MSYPSTTSGPWRFASRALSRIASTLALLALSACWSLPLRPQPELPLPPAPVLPAPQPLKLESVTWKVTEQGGIALFSLDARGYEALSRNMAEVAAWMREASWQLDFYRRTRTTNTNPPEVPQ